MLLRLPQSPSRLVAVLLETLEFIKEVKYPFLFDVKHGIALHAMQGNWASSRGDLGYTELFPVADGTSASL